MSDDSGLVSEYWTATLSGSAFLESQEKFRRAFAREDEIIRSIDSDQSKIKTLEEFAQKNIQRKINTIREPSSRAWKIFQSLDIDPDKDYLPALHVEKGLPAAEIEELFATAVQARKSLDQAVFFGGSQREVLRSCFKQLEEYRLSALVLADRIEEGISKKKENFRVTTKQLGAALVAEYADQKASVEAAQQWMGPTAVSGFDLQEWAAWTPPAEPQFVNLGNIFYPRPESNSIPGLPGSFSYPLLVSLPDNGRLLFKHDAAGRDAAQSAVRALMLRILGAFPAGRANFTIFDPLGLGDSAAPFLALSDHNKDFLGGKIWSSAQDLSKQLGEITAHIEHVITRYLRGDYSTIAEYNAAAGEIAENYRVLVIFDFPAQFSEETQFELKRILENGPRCGVFTVVVSNSGVKANYGVSDAEFPGVRLESEGAFVGLPVDGHYPLLEFDADPISRLGQTDGQKLIDSVVDRVGREGRTATESAVNLAKTHGLFAAAVEARVRSDIPAEYTAVDTTNPTTWWKNSTRDACLSPVGPSSARDVAIVRFDSSSMAGGFLIGRMGSGKSTLLHTYLAGLTMLYAPDELELYLIDFKEGVEFASYAEAQLPHAVCVAIESEREFGLSVLESVVEEMQRRGALFRSTGGQQTTFASMRDREGAKLPRIVLVFDEFHVLFAQDDKIGAKSAELMETIIRQGRGFGVHVLLASQTLSGMSAFPRQKLDLLPVRMLLGSTREDADIVLGEANQGWKLISKPGEGVLNNSGGAVEGNIVFLGAFEEDADRMRRLSMLRQKATSEGHSRRPVVFEGFKAAELESESCEEFRDHISPPSPYVLSLRAGRSLTLAGPANLLLRRESGANVLLIARDVQGAPLGIIAAGLVSLLAGSAKVQVHFVNFLSIDEEIEVALSGLAESDQVELLRARKLVPLLENLASEVRRRVEEEDDRAAARVLYLFGVHRARDLTNELSSPYDDEGAPSPDDLLKEILSDGPDVGIHVVAWAESANALDRRFDRTTLGYFGHVMGTRMAREDSVRLFDVDVAAQLRDNQVFYADLEGGLERKMMAYALPSPVWIKNVLQASE